MTAKKPPPLDMDKVFRDLAALQDEINDYQRRDRAEKKMPPLWACVERDYPMRPRKERVSLRIDEDVLAWFRAQGVGHQARMNATLRAYMLCKLVKLV